LDVVVAPLAHKIQENFMLFSSEKIYHVPEKLAFLIEAFAFAA
jgi:hypothetical protein